MKLLAFTSALLLAAAPAYAVCGSIVSQSPGIDAPGSIAVDHAQGAGANQTIQYSRLTGQSCSQKEAQLQEIIQRGHDLRTAKSSFGLDDPDRFDLLDSPSYFDAREDGVRDANPAENTWVVFRCNIYTVDCDATNSNFVVTITTAQ